VAVREKEPDCNAKQRGEQRGELGEKETEQGALTPKRPQRKGLAMKWKECTERQVHMRQGDRIHCRRNDKPGHGRKGME
jgi:hypothetical protein